MTRSSVALLVALILVPCAARAQEVASSDPSVPFDEGRALVRVGRYAEALVKFEDSFKIKATSGALINMADCYEKLGRHASASSAFERAATLAASNDQAERAQEANDRRATVTPLVSHLTVKAPAGTKVTVDGEPATPGHAMAIDGGEHVVRVEAQCRMPSESRVNVGLRADAMTVTMALGAQSTEAACGGPPPTMNVVSLPAEPPSSWGTQKTVAVVLGSASLVALGAGIGFGLSASSKQDEPERTHDDASRAAAFSTVGIVAGLVFLGAAVGLYLTAPKTTRTAGTLTRIAF
jgi:hypothetical protein